MAKGRIIKAVSQWTKEIRRKWRFMEKIIVGMKQFSCNSSDMQMSAPLLKFITIFSYLTKDLAPNPLKQEKRQG